MKSVAETSEITKYNALERVPASAMWPPPWLAAWSATMSECPPAASLLTGPAEEIQEAERGAELNGNDKSAASWPSDIVPLIDWFTSNRDQVPHEPFLLRSGTHVKRPHRFYEALDRDIAAGPASVRARCGLQSDLTDLRNVLEGASAPAAFGQASQPASC
jgi:hypothetical protein